MLYITFTTIPLVQTLPQIPFLGYKACKADLVTQDLEQTYSKYPVHEETETYIRIPV